MTFVSVAGITGFVILGCAAGQVLISLLVDRYRGRPFVTLLLALACGSAEAGSCRKVVCADVVVVPFAVPVGVPVATAAQVMYQYGTGAAQAQQPQRLAGGCRCNCGGTPADGNCPETPDSSPVEPAPAGPEPIMQAEPEGAAILRAKCASCHTAPNTKGGLVLIDGEGWAANWREHRRAIFDKVRTGEMPKGGPPLTDQEFTSVVDWLLSD